MDVLSKCTALLNNFRLSRLSKDYKSVFKLFPEEKRLLLDLLSFIRNENLNSMSAKIVMTTTYSVFSGQVSRPLMEIQKIDIGNACYMENMIGICESLEICLSLINFAVSSINDVFNLLSVAEWRNIVISCGQILSIVSESPKILIQLENCLCQTSLLLASVIRDPTMSLSLLFPSEQLDLILSQITLTPLLILENCSSIIISQSCTDLLLEILSSTSTSSLNYWIKVFPGTFSHIYRIVCTRKHHQRISTRIKLTIFLLSVTRLICDDNTTTKSESVVEIACRVNAHLPTIISSLVGLDCWRDQPDPDKLGLVLISCLYDIVKHCYIALNSCMPIQLEGLVLLSCSELTGVAFSARTQIAASNYLAMLLKDLPQSSLDGIQSAVSNRVIELIQSLDSLIGLHSTNSLSMAVSLSSNYIKILASMDHSCTVVHLRLFLDVILSSIKKLMIIDLSDVTNNWYMANIKFYSRRMKNYIVCESVLPNFLYFPKDLHMSCIEPTAITQEEQKQTECDICPSIDIKMAIGSLTNVSPDVNDMQTLNSQEIVGKLCGLLASLIGEAWIEAIVEKIVKPILCSENNEESHHDSKMQLIWVDNRSTYSWILWNALLFIDEKEFEQDRDRRVTSVINRIMSCDVLSTQRSDKSISLSDAFMKKFGIAQALSLRVVAELATQLSARRLKVFISASIFSFVLFCVNDSECVQYESKSLLRRLSNEQGYYSVDKVNLNDNSGMVILLQRHSDHIVDHLCKIFRNKRISVEPNLTAGFCPYFLGSEHDTEIFFSECKEERTAFIAGSIIDFMTANVDPSKPDIIPLMNDLIKCCLDAVDRNQHLCNQGKTLAYAKLLKNISSGVLCIMKSRQLPCKPKLAPKLSCVEKLKEWLKLVDSIYSPKAIPDYQDKEDVDLDHSMENEDDIAAKASLEDESMIRVLDRCHYFVTMPDIMVQVAAVDATQNALNVISYNSRLYLPWVHKMWATVADMIRLISRSCLDSLYKGKVRPRPKPPNLNIFQSNNGSVNDKDRTEVNNESNTLIIARKVTRYTTSNQLLDYREGVVRNSHLEDFSKTSIPDSVLSKFSDISMNKGVSDAVTSYRLDQILTSIQQNADVYSHPHLLISLLSLVGDISEKCGDFLSIKFEETLWPAIEPLLNEFGFHSHSQSNKLSKETFIQSTEDKICRQVLRCLNSFSSNPACASYLFKHVEIMTLLSLPYLNDCVWHESVVSTAKCLIVSLHSIDRPAVWSAIFPVFAIARCSRELQSHWNFKHYAKLFQIKTTATESHCALQNLSNLAVELRICEEFIGIA